MHHFRDLLALIAIGFLIAPTRAPGNTVAATPVAISGQPAPGVAGKFASFQRPLISNQGDVAFIAATDGLPASQGVWLQSNGAPLASIVHAGQDAPGAGSPFNLFQDLRLNDVGQVAFSASTGTDSTFATGGIWRAGLTLAPTAIALRSSVAAARLSGFNSLGQATVIGTDGPSANETVWVGRSTSDLAPAAALGPTRVFGNVPLTASGQLALSHNFVNSNDPEVTIGYEVLAGPASSATTLIVRGPSEAVAVGSMNDAGQVAFSATDRLWIGKQGAGVAPVVGPASAVPGVPAASFGSIGLPAINHSGQLAFRAVLAGAGLGPANNSGIFTGPDAESLQLVARTGEPLAQLPGFVISSVGMPQINAAGQMIFTGTVSGAAEPSDLAIFGYDPGAGLQVLIRAGDLLRVGPAQSQSVLSVSLADTNADLLSGGEDGLGTNLNDAGRFAFLATLSDGQRITSGVFVGSVPEPSAALWCIPLIGCALWRRIRHPHTRPSGLKERRPRHL
jgi:hypothetical protein